MPNRARQNDELVPNEVSDHSLLRRLRSGSEDAATALYVRYARRLRDLTRANSSPDLASRVDADDIVQSVFRTFFRRVARGEYDVPDGDELWKLFLVIGLNKLRAVSAFHRAAKRNVRASTGGDALTQASLQVAQSDDAPLTVLRMLIEDVLTGLSVSHREIIDMRIEGYEVAEIAAKLRRSKRSVERILQCFRQMLAKMIHEDQ